MELRKMTRDEIIAILQKHEAVVTFTKVNGEIRTMPCTLQEHIVPAAAAKQEGSTAKAVNDNVVSAWCTDKQAWRSFRVDSVTEIAI
jgi:hypothetical protein